MCYSGASGTRSEDFFPRTGKKSSACWKEASREGRARVARAPTRGTSRTACTGLPWRDLPTEFGPRKPAWKRHHRFSTDGTWDKVLTVLQAQADAAGQIDWRV